MNVTASYLRRVICMTMIAIAVLGFKVLSAGGKERADAACLGPAAMCWEPQWRQPNDCGPLCLFLLFRILDKQVTLDEVKKAVRFDPNSGEGCSMEALRAAAEQMGVPMNVRYVNPRDLRKLRGPFIVHGITSIERNLGHFILVVNYDSAKERYAIIDENYARFGWLPESTIVNTFSGYVLIPKEPRLQKGRRFVGSVLLILGGAFLLGGVRAMLRRRRNEKQQIEVC